MNLIIAKFCMIMLPLSITLDSAVCVCGLTSFNPNLLLMSHRLRETRKRIAAAVVKPCLLSSLTIFCQTSAVVPGIPKY